MGMSSWNQTGGVEKTKEGTGSAMPLATAPHRISGVEGTFKVNQCNLFTTLLLLKTVILFWQFGLLEYRYLNLDVGGRSAPGPSSFRTNLTSLLHINRFHIWRPVLLSFSCFKWQGFVILRYLLALLRSPRKPLQREYWSLQWNWLLLFPLPPPSALGPALVGVKESCLLPL